MQSNFGSCCTFWTSRILVFCFLPFVDNDPCAGVENEIPHFASGIKVVEVQQDSARIWVRLTRHPEADYSRLEIFTKGLAPKQKSNLEMPTDVVPGVNGQAKVIYWLRNAPTSKRETDWLNVLEQEDYIRCFELSKLEPGSEYEFEVRSRLTHDSGKVNSVRGRFQTAFARVERKPVRFIVSTCQAVRSIDSGKRGHRAYQQMLEMEPHFFVHTGDILYYDKVPLCKNKESARAKWNLMFAYGHSKDFHRNISSYFMKDDHDTLKNDCWPGQRYGDLTFEQGLQIFRVQVGIGDKTYRTVRWGKDLQIWMTENRDFRSSNRMPDGPEKTILGEEQKSWLQNSIRNSDATFKFVISPGPIVGPDKKGKRDNHSNQAFQTEGQQLRDFLSKQKNTFVICGDRHWQYCSKDPKTGLVEFGCGPINDEHNFGGNPGVDQRFHRYFGAKGGFLMVSIAGESGKAEWFHANDKNWTTGRQPRILHTELLPTVD